MATSADLKLGTSPADNFLKDFRVRLSWSSLLHQCWLLAVMTTLGVVSYLLISHFIFQSLQVDGRSMVPTLENSGHYWLNRLAYVKSEPQRTDVVALKDPQDNTLVVKRIIAGPGESVYLHQGKVYVNGALLTEPYLLDKTPTYAYEKNEDEFICVGKNSFFVMGDNRNNSTDSRTFGSVPRQNILGKVVE